MSRRLGARNIKLVFTGDSILAGLTATFRRPSMDELMELTEADIEANSVNTNIRIVAGLLGNLMVSWDQEDEDGVPLPPDATGLGRLDPEEFHELMDTYMANTGGVSAPLAPDSPSGEPSQAVSEMTELSLLSQPN